MMQFLKIATFLLLCAAFAAAQTPSKTQAPGAAQNPAPAQPPATTQPPAAAQAPATSPQAATPDIAKPMLEFANAKQAKIAWTSHHAADLDLHYSTDRNNLNQGAVGAVEKMGGDNHRATLTNLQPNTTYYVQMTNKSGQPVGGVYTFKTPAQGQPAIHEQPLGPS